MKFSSRSILPYYPISNMVVWMRIRIIWNTVAINGGFYWGRNFFLFDLWLYGLASSQVSFLKNISGRNLIETGIHLIHRRNVLFKSFLNCFLFWFYCFLFFGSIFFFKQIIHEKVIFRRREIYFDLAQNMFEKIFFKQLLPNIFLGFEHSNRFEGFHGIEHGW